MAHRSTLALRVVAWMYLASGVVFFVAPPFAFTAAGGLGPNLILWPMAAVTLAAGVGLLRRAPWAWPFTLLLALSGVAVTVARLWGGGGAQEGLIAALTTNVVVLVVLFLARDRGAAPGA